MAKNMGRGSRAGAVSGRSQVRNPKTGMWTKRDTTTVRFTQAKTSGGSFKGVKKEKLRSPHRRSRVDWETITVWAVMVLSCLFFWWAFYRAVTA